MTERFIIAARKKGTSYNLPLTRKQKKKIQEQWTKFLLIALKYVARCGHISSERCFLYSYYQKWMKFCPIDCVFFFLSVVGILFSFFQVFFLRSGSAIRFGFFVDFYLLLLNFSRLPSSRFRPHYFPSIDFRSIIISTVSRDLHGTFSKPWRRQLKVCGKTKDLISRIKA